VELCVLSFFQSRKTKGAHRLLTRAFDTLVVTIIFTVFG
jgi:hypothetical protein